MHWSPEQNRRFRVYRLDGPTNHVGRYPGAVWDADRKEWIDQYRQGGIAGHELARAATTKDLKGVEHATRELAAVDASLLALGVNVEG